tara:strand:- start:909 stop:1223 length:315 start_codon:yes stop_codon:yes gene_type:complete
MTESSPDKFINGIAHLTALNKKAIRKNYNRQLDIKAIVESIKKKRKFSQIQDVSLTRFPITFSMIHNDTEVRVIFIINDAGDKVQLDMSFDDYADLPSISGIMD